MSHPQERIQTKLFAVLNGDSHIKGLVKGVFDYVPDNQKTPYIVLGEMPLEDFGTKDGSGFQGDIVIHFFSQAAGKQEVMRIMSRAWTLLHNLDFGFTDFPTITFRCILTDVLKDPDTKTHHGIQKYRLILGGK